MKDAKNPNALEHLTQGLSALAARMEAKDAAQVGTILVQAMNDAKDSSALSWLASALSALAARMEPVDAAQAGTALVQATMKQGGYIWLGNRLSRILAAFPPAEVPSRAATVAASLALPAGTGQALAALTLIILAAEPAPCRLSTEQLVELLKMPPFVGDARRIVVDQLGNRYHRHFADVWEFVRYAEEHKLDLDFTSPPKRR